MLKWSRTRAQALTVAYQCPQEMLIAAETVTIVWTISISALWYWNIACMRWRVAFIDIWLGEYWRTKIQVTSLFGVLRYVQNKECVIAIIYVLPPTTAQWSFHKFEIFRMCLLISHLAHSYDAHNRQKHDRGLQFNPSFTDVLKIIICIQHLASVVMKSTSWQLSSSWTVSCCALPVHTAPFPVHPRSHMHT